MDEQPVVQQKPFDWKTPLIIIGVIGWLLSGFFGYSLKKVTEERDSLKVTSTSTHSEGVTIYKWQEVAGKAYPVTEVSNINDRSTSSFNENKEKKITEIWKSGVAIGPAISLAGHRAGVFDADLIPLGPGTIQVGALAGPEEQWGWVSYRFLF